MYIRHGVALYFFFLYERDIKHEALIDVQLVGWPGYFIKKRKKKKIKIYSVRIMN